MANHGLSPSIAILRTNPVTGTGVIAGASSGSAQATVVDANGETDGFG